MLVEVPFIEIIGQFVVLAKLFTGHKLLITAFAIAVVGFIPTIISVIRDHPHKNRIIICNLIVIGAMCVPYASVLGIAGWATTIVWAVAERELLQDNI